MPDNLTITIRADTAKLRADLALGVADLKRFQQELNKVAAEASRSGDTAAVSRAAEQVQRQTQYVAGLRQALGGLTQAHRQAAAGAEEFRGRLAAMREPLAQIRAGFNELSNRTFPGWRAIAGLSIAAVTTELVKFTQQSAVAIKTNKELADTFGATSGQMQALQLGAAEAGASFEDLTGHMERTFKQFSQAQEKAALARGQLPGDPTTVLRGATSGLRTEALVGGVTVLRGATDATQKSVDGLARSLNTLEGAAGQTVNVLRGGGGVLNNMSTAAEKLGIDINAFAHNFEGYRQYIAAFVKALDLRDPATRAALAADEWGKHWVEQLKLARALISPELNAFAAELERAGLLFTRHQEEQTEAYDKSLARLRVVFGFLRDVTANVLGEAFTPFFAGLSKLLEDNTGRIVKWAEATRNSLAAFGRDILAFLQQGRGAKFETQGMQDFVGLLGLAETAVGKVRGAFQGLIGVLDGVAGAINAVFGTDWSGRGIAIAVVIAQISGAFTILGGVIRTTTAALWLLNTAAAVNPYVAIAAAIVALGVAIYAWRKEIGAALDWVWQKWVGFANWISNTFLNLVGLGAKSFTQAWADAFAWFARQIRNIASLAKQAWSWATSGGPGEGAAGAGRALAAGSENLPGMARGGMVRGVGFGDTVPALLMPGEFVARAAAVRHYGAGAFAALNQQRIPRFDFGGLVDPVHARSGPHFAEGGLVGGGAGPPYAPINLYIGGGRFPVRAGQDVAAALVMEAQHAQMVSAGARPSWFGR